MHFAGIITPEYNQILGFCRDHGLFVIEDAAHAPGGMFGEKFAGTLGDIGCFSFFPSKVITAAEGGMLTTNNNDIAKSMLVAFKIEAEIWIAKKKSIVFPEEM